MIQPCALLLLILMPLAAQSSAVRPIETLFGGTLVVGGGGGLPKDVFDAFLAGARRGRRASQTPRIVVIPTASAAADQGTEPIAAAWSKRLGCPVQVLHTRDRKVADTAEFVAPLAQADGVWISGGSQSRLSEAYAGTAVEAALRKMLVEGRAVGGSSAGAAILTRTMIASGMPKPTMGVGFDLLPGCIIDQHFSERERRPRLEAAVQAHPSLVGVGVDEGTALVVRSRRMRVLGKGTVSVVLAATKFRPRRVDVLRANRRGPDLMTYRRAAILRGSGRDHAHEPRRPHVENGTLILVGGGAMSRELWQAFVAAAGGEKARIVTIPTANGAPRGASRTAALLRRMGVKDVTTLHATDPAKIRDEAFLGPLRKATGIWFGGGRQWRLVDAYEGTEALPLFHDVLARGGVIAGSSAGTSIQGEFMARGNPLGNREGFIEGYEKGFGFFPGTAIDQHFSQRGRLPDLQRLARTYPKLLALGIDEGTGIVVRKSKFDVLGPGKVFIHQAGVWCERKGGESYDMSGLGAQTEKRKRF